MQPITADNIINSRRHCITPTDKICISDYTFAMWQNRAAKDNFAALLPHLDSPIKNRAIVPGPEWAPMVGPI